MKLEEFLKDLGLEKYLVKFINAEIEDIETLKKLTEDNFKELKVELGSRIKLLKALKNLNNDSKEVSPSSSITYPKNLYPNNMVSYLAHPWKEYVEETHSSVKLHWLIDASETIVRWICALLLAEIKEANEQKIPEEIQKKFKENISRPTLGIWLNIVKELSEIKIENPNIKDLFSFYNNVLNKNGLFPDDGDEKTSLLKLRNRVAHGGGLSQSQSKIYLDIYEPHLILFLEFVNKLMNKCKLYGVFENRCYFLQGLEPNIVENSSQISGPFIEINGKNLSLWPLVEFDKIRQIDNNGIIKELSSITTQTYLRTDKQGIQYVPIGVDEAYSITNKQEEFENIFGLNKKNENSSKIKDYEYTYKDFLVEAKYLKEELIGRVEEIKSIKSWIKSADAFSNDKCRLIYGGPGLGKSMIMASVVSDISNDLNHHTFYYRFRGGDGRNSKFWFLKLLNDSLYSWNKLKEICSDEPAKTSNSDDLFKDVIKRIEKIKDLESIQRKIGKDSNENLKPTLRLFIDGLDEITAQDSSMLRVIEFLQKEGVLTLIASRLENAVSNLKELSWIKPFVFKDDIEGLPPMSNNDIRAMLIEGISKSQKKELIKNDKENKDIINNPIVEEIAKKANGLPLYIYLLIEDINKNRYSIVDIDKLPDGLTKYYSELVDRMGISSIKEYLTKVITLLSITTEPLDVESISLSLVNIDAAKDRETLIKDVIQAAGTLLKQVTTNEGTQGYSLYHQSFRDFILKADKDLAHPLYHTLEDMKIALYLKASSWQELPISNFKNHIFRAGNYYTLWWQNNGVNLVKDSLMNLEYLLDRTKSLKVEDLNLLMDEYELIETKIEKDELKEFRIWSSFFREKMHLINKIDEELWRPYKTLFQVAYEDGDDSPLTIQAEKLIKENKIEFEWLKLVNREKSFTRTGLLKVLEGHSDCIRGVKILEDGRILSYSDDKTLRLWDEDGKFLELLEGHSDSISGVKILDDGRILSYSYDSTLRLWDKNGKFLEELKGHSGSISGVKILKDGRILSYSGDNTLRLWDNNGKFLELLEGHSDSINGVEILDDGRILSYSDDKTLRLWDNKGKFLEELKGRHSGPINGVEILDDGRILSYSIENIFEYSDDDMINEVEILDNEIILSSSSDKTFEYPDYDFLNLNLWDNNGKFLEELKGHSGSINGVKILDDGRILSYSDDNTLRLWDNNGKFLEVLEGHSGPVNRVEILTDGRILSYSSEFPSNSNDNTPRLWDKNGKFLELLEGHSDSISGVKILDDGRILSYSYDNTLRLWDKNGKSLKELKGHSDYVYGVKILKDGRILSYSNDNIFEHIFDNTIRLWDNEGNEQKVLKGHSNSINGIEILDDERILSYSKDKSLRLWDCKDNELKILKKYDWFRLQILADGKILDYSDEKTLKLWDYEGNEVKTLEGHRGSINGVEILANGKILSYSKDKTLRLWDKNGNFLKELKGHRDLINGVKILPDGKILSYSDDASLRLWDKEGNFLKELEKYTYGKSNVEILNDGKILTHSKCFSPYLCDNNRNFLKELNFSVNGVEILEDGRILSYSNDDTFRLWDSEGNLLKVIDVDNYFDSVKLLNNGKILIYSNGGTPKLLDNNGNFLKGLGGDIYGDGGVEILNDGKILIYSEYSTPQLWDKDGNFLKKLSFLIKGVKILADGRILSYSGDNTLRLWDKDGNFFKELKGHNNSINGVEILANGRILSYSYIDKTIRIWNSQGEIVKVLYNAVDKDINGYKIGKYKNIIATDGNIFIY